MKVADRAEAFAAVSLVVVGADGVGTFEERDFLFSELLAVDAFAGYDAETLGSLLGKLTARMVTELPHDLDASSVELKELCASVRAVLPDEDCSRLFSLAARLSCTDGLGAKERALGARNRRAGRRAGDRPGGGVGERGRRRGGSSGRESRKRGDRLLAPLYLPAPLPTLSRRHPMGPSAPLPARTQPGRQSNCP